MEMNKVNVGDYMRRECGTLYKVTEWNEAYPDEGIGEVIESTPSSLTKGRTTKRLHFWDNTLYTPEPQKAIIFQDLYTKLSS
jgi:hypothetical protein